MSSEKPRLRVVDILDNIAAVQSYAEPHDLISFSNHRLTVDACERCLQRITEAAIKIGEEAMADVAPSIPFHKLRGFGNVLRHEYDGIDDQLIFDTIKLELPLLKDECERYLKNEGNNKK